MGKKIYVGNLGYSVTSSDLEQMFKAHGNVQSAEVISDRTTGSSKGFGFVEMESADEAAAAITASRAAHFQHLPTPAAELLDNNSYIVLGHVDHHFFEGLEHFPVRSLLGDDART